MKRNNRILFIVSTVVLIAAVAAIIIYVTTCCSKAKVYDELSSIAHESETETETEAPTETEMPAETTTAKATEETTTEEAKAEIPIDFEALKAFNPDIYAWITIPDSEIDYPILQKTDGDPDYYLNRTASEEMGLPGSIYTQYNHNQDFDKDPVTFIYGHRTNYGGMFGQLGEYMNEEFREKHSEFSIYTPQKAYTYKVVFAVTFGNDNLLYRFNDCETEEDYQGLLDAIRTERLMPSWISDPLEVSTDDHLVVLSTCNIDYTQRVLIGAVREDEP